MALKSADEDWTEGAAEEPDALASGPSDEAGVSGVTRPLAEEAGAADKLSCLAGASFGAEAGANCLAGPMAAGGVAVAAGATVAAAGGAVVPGGARTKGAAAGAGGAVVAGATSIATGTLAVTSGAAPGAPDRGPASAQAAMFKTSPNQELSVQSMPKTYPLAHSKWRIYPVPPGSAGPGWTGSTTPGGKRKRKVSLLTPELQGNSSWMHSACTFLSTASSSCSAALSRDWIQLDISALDVQRRSHQRFCKQRSSRKTGMLA